MNSFLIHADKDFACTVKPVVKKKCPYSDFELKLWSYSTLAVTFSSVNDNDRIGSGLGQRDKRNAPRF